MVKNQCFIRSKNAQTEEKKTRDKRLTYVSAWLLQKKKERLIINKNRLLCRKKSQNSNLSEAFVTLAIICYIFLDVRGEKPISFFQTKI